MTYADYNAQMRDTHGKQNEINLRMYKTKSTKICLKMLFTIVSHDQEHKTSTVSNSESSLNPIIFIKKCEHEANIT